MPIAGSCCIRCRTLSLLPACLRCVLPAVPSHRPSSRSSSPRSSTWLAGREAGSVGTLLAWFCPAVCSDVDSRLTPFPMRCSIRLLACQVRCRCSHLVVWMRCDVLLAHRSVSSLASFIIPSVGSVPASRPVLRHDGRGADAVRLRCDCGVLSFLFLIS